MRSIYWFRQDLRISDNPALYEAAKSGEILPVYILTDYDSKNLGAVSKWWLHNSLISLNESLGGKLLFLEGDPIDILPKLVNDMAIDAIYWNRCYEPYNLNYDKEIIKVFRNCHIFNGSLLWENILKPDGTPYKVFTHFYRKGCLQGGVMPRKPLPKPLNIRFINYNYIAIDSLKLLPKINWHRKLENHWSIGEESAANCLDNFLRNKLYNYKVGRDFPGEDFVSQLSPHIHFGEISPNQIWYKAIEGRDISEKNLDHFLSELGWREFSYNLLYNFPKLKVENLNQKFNKFPWINNEDLVEKWKKGETGFPIIDAGMRELWSRGYIHNRVRMIVASFLIKNLMIDWRIGEEWFWDCLVDADMANNAASWQWVAGSGADAAPYFRIFNPITQSEKFDHNGKYIRKYIPEIAHLPDKYIAKPWTYSEKLKYPQPIIDLEKSREAALNGFKSIGV
jgi:deoxyribodipyrimidine photo-lyase